MCSDDVLKMQFMIPRSVFLGGNAGVFVNDTDVERRDKVELQDPRVCGGVFVFRCVSLDWLLVCLWEVYFVGFPASHTSSETLRLCVCVDVFVFVCRRTPLDRSFFVSGRFTLVHVSVSLLHTVRLKPSDLHLEFASPSLDTSVFNYLSI